MVRQVEVVSVVEAVTADLRRQILRGELEPDTPLSEAEVAGRYDIARPTARAVIEALVFGRLLDRRAHRTARVVRLGPSDVRDVYRTRERLESQVLLELAADRSAPAAALTAHQDLVAVVAAGADPLAVVEADLHFHTSLVDALDSPRTSRAYAGLVSEVQLCMAQVQGRGLLSTEVVVAEHGRLLGLVAAGDGPAAVAVLATHLGRARERLVAALGGEPVAVVGSA